MGQAGSTTQNQAEQGGAGSAGGGNEQQRRTPGRPGLHYTRSLRERHQHQQQQQQHGGSNRESTSSRFTSRDGHRDGGSGSSPTKPRRKSLDMPDMSLSMTGAGGGGTGGTATPSAAGTPVQQRASLFPPRQNSSAAQTPADSVHTSPKTSLRIPHSGDAGGDEAVPMTSMPISGEAGSNTKDVYTNVTSPTVSSAVLSPAARWARHKDGIKEGFGKKAQPVVEAAVLHAAGTSAGQASQNNNAPSLSTSPTTPFQPLSKVSPNSSRRVKLPPVDTAQVRRFETGDTSILSAQNEGSSFAQSSGFVTRHNEVHGHPPSAPGQAIDPAQLTSLLKSGQLKEAQALQAARAEQSLEGCSRQSSTDRGKTSPATSNVTVQQQHLSTGTGQDQHQASQPPTPGVAGSFTMPVPIPSPLKQPTETILAPELPHDVLIVVPTYMPSELTHAITDSTGHPLPAMGAGAAGTSQSAMTSASRSEFASPLIPGSTPPLGNPPNTLPAAASIAALNPTLAQDPKAQEAVKNATVDLGAGPDGVATLLTWKAEEETTGAPGLDGSGALKTKVPSQVFVTGTFAKWWSTKIELRRNHDDPKHDKDFTALVKLPPGAHSLKFIVDKQWKTSKYLPSATDADGNLVNYLQVHKVDSIPKGQSKDDHVDSDVEEDDEQWTQEIPPVLLAYGEATEAALDAQDAARELDYQRSIQASNSAPMPALPQLDQSHNYTTGENQGPSSIPNVLPNPAILALQRKPLSQLALIQPPSLPAQLEKGVLNATVLVARGSGDDNSILPKPDHSVLNHLAASPIKGGLLSVGATTRYRRKYVTTVYYKKPM